ncbi:MAG: 16S rRNA (uracil(1498)-N(3))-methyltransferase [Bacteroidales bacterium]|nr:16S rRNA (uracil(1498)-N(3))-methyltransferase [Bacteroidales bacterium]
MELFYAKEAQGSVVTLDQEESGHCIKVLRHRVGDEVCVIDGKGTMLRCRLIDANAKGAQLEVLERTEGFGVPQYHLTLACCPTKNNDRFEWMVEKATEMGVDRIVPLIGERSERKVYKSDRARRIALSAAKQSLKALVPEVEEPVSVKEFLKRPLKGIGLIAYCFDERIGIIEAIDTDEITVLIGPEGDFSPEEAALAIERGYRPIHLGPSRLRTETAALAAVSAVYLKFIGKAYVSED